MTTRTRNIHMARALISGAATIAVGALILAAPGPAHADDPAPVREARVSYADLDLTRPEGMETLRARIESAARAVCGRRQARTMKEIAESRECYAAAVAEALGRVERPVAAELRWTVSVAREAS